MPTSLSQILRSQWFGWTTHVALWGVLILALARLGGKAPEFSVSDTSAAPPPSPVPVAKLEALLTPNQWPKPLVGTNTLNPFFTRHFVPPPTPPPPPAPTTRKIEVTYQGFYISGDRPKEAILKVAEAFVTARLGASIATNLFVADASFQTLTLTNLEAQTNVLTLNIKKEIEVPIK